MPTGDKEKIYEVTYRGHVVRDNPLEPKKMLKPKSILMLTADELGEFKKSFKDWELKVRIFLPKKAHRMSVHETDPITVEPKKAVEKKADKKDSKKKD